MALAALLLVGATRESRSVRALTRCRGIRDTFLRNRRTQLHNSVFHTEFSHFISRSSKRNMSIPISIKLLFNLRWVPALRYLQVLIFCEDILKSLLCPLFLLGYLPPQNPPSLPINNASVILLCDMVWHNRTQGTRAHRTGPITRQHFIMSHLFLPINLSKTGRIFRRMV